MQRDWPTCTYQKVPWQQQVRAGSKSDRMLRSISVCIPAEIATQNFSLDSRLAAQSESAVSAITQLDNYYGDALQSLNQLLIRVESVASSKIENIHATSEEYARAQYGNKSNSSALQMVAGTQALTALIDSAGPGKKISAGNIKEAHFALMKNLPREEESAGKYRKVQNWIGGSDHSPLGAIFVPPPADQIEKLMKDLLIFANREDIPALVQATLAHAQFETIHPFADGNGRIGRGLVNAILRRRNITAKVVVPIASFLIANRSAYFEDLTAYRDGQIENILTRFATAAEVASVEASRMSIALSALPTIWRKKLGTVRSGGSTSKLLELLISNPVFSADELVGVIASNPSSIYNAISKLKDSKILIPLTSSLRNQIWGALEVLNELEELDRRISAKGRV